MATVSRSTKIAGGTVLTAHSLARAQDVETDILTLFNAHNNHDSGASKWTAVSAENALTTPLIVNNSTGTNDIVDFRDNGTTVFKIADGGAITFAGPLSMTGSGNGILLTTPDGAHTYRLTISNSGELQTEQIS